ncbi:MAG: hypothetical protein ACOZCL_08440 [Bacillota bacterium]
MRTFKIGGYNVVVEPTWSISDKINARTTMSFTVIDLGLLTEINEGDSILVEQDGTKIFSGIIHSIEDYEENPGELYYSITAVDNSAKADKRLIADTAVNEYAGNIITNKILPILAQEGVTAGNIAQGQIITKAVFNYIKASEALDYLRDVTGFIWEIDFDNKLNFYSRSTNISPITLSNSVQHSSFRRKRSLEQYRNRQYIRAGKSKTAAQNAEQPTPKPDGVTRNFVTRFPLAERPIIEINLNSAGWVAISSADIGVNGLDTNKKWYFRFDSNIITQDETETILTDADAIRVTYNGLVNILTYADNPAEISDRKAKETGTSGIYESLVEEKSIDESNQAIEFANGLIQKYGEVMDTIDFETEVHGLKAGQLLPVQKPLYGINSDFLIESISIYPIDSSTIEYSVHALDSPAVGGWEVFFKNIIKGGRQFVIAGNEVLILLNTQTETEGYQGSVNVKVVQALYPADDLYPAEDLYPGTLTSEVTLND